MSAPVKLVPRKPALPEARMLGADFARQAWSVDLPEGITLEQAMDPTYWAHVARKLRPGARLEVLSEDGKVDADLRVTAVRGMNVYTRVLRHGYVDETKPGSEPAKVETKPGDDLPRVAWGGPNHKWRVLGIDGQVVAHGYATEEAAAEKLRDYRAELAAGGVTQR